MISLKTNLNNIYLTNHINRVKSNQSQSFERLATGIRLNHAKDFVADYIISEKLEYELSAKRVKSNNISQKINVFNCAIGESNNLQEKLLRIRDLCVQASNDTYGIEERSAMQQEIDAQISEFERTLDNAKYGHIKLFDKSNFQIEIIELSEKEALDRGYKLVQTIDDLKNIKSNDKNAKYILMNDIDLSNIEWNAIKNFKGEFNGNGHVIKNLNINKPNMYSQGLFGTLDNATIKNLGLEGGSITANSEVGSLAGTLLNNSKISNCYSSNINIEGKNHVGGLIGLARGNSNIINCHSSGEIKGEYCTGGLVGIYYQNSSIEKCYTTANTTGKRHTGGLIGAQRNSTVKNCYVEGNIYGEINTGGLIGYQHDSSSISQCYMSGDIKGIENIGGIAGFEEISCNIKNSHSKGNIEGNKSIGGIAGYSDSSIVSNCSTSTNIIGNSHIGGIIGTLANNSTLENSKTKSKISASANKIGNAIGDNRGNNVTKNIICYSSINPTLSKVGSGKDSGIIDKLEPQNGEFEKIELDKQNFKESLNTFFSIDISDINSAQDSIKKVDKYLNQFSSKLSDFASTCNKLETSLDLNRMDSENLTISNSVIKDTDIAQESCNFVQNQILEQATLSLLQMANQMPNSVLKLISQI